MLWRRSFSAGHRPILSAGDQATEISENLNASEIESTFKKKIILDLAYFLQVL